MSGTLYVVATPIGNLEDITLRALSILRSVSLIAAEDTRRTAKLLAHYAIRTPTLSFHEHNSRSRLPQLLQRLSYGESIALVSDAGTPGVSDPGAELVQAALQAGARVDSLPGASATLTALAISGFPGVPHTFLGFPPRRSNDRNKWFSRLAAEPGTAIFFESPHRIAATLRQAAQFLGERQIVVARELTKVHQEIMRGPANMVYDLMTNIKGEFTVVVGPNMAATHGVMAVTPARAADDFGVMTESGALTRRQAIVELGKRYGQSPKAVYALVEAGKSSVK
jgi:16S rRNA (cytidine1402-2'-O)-methyltransferase